MNFLRFLFGYPPRRYAWVQTGRDGLMVEYVPVVSITPTVQAAYMDHNWWIVGPNSNALAVFAEPKS